MPFAIEYEGLVGDFYFLFIIIHGAIINKQYDILVTRKVQVGRLIIERRCCLCRQSNTMKIVNVDSKVILQSVFLVLTHFILI